MRRNIHACPVCGGAMEIARLNCTRCEVRIEGRFQMCRFCELEPEHLEFLEVFIKNRGVIRDMEKELGVSYPTVRARLDAMLTALGYEAVTTASPQEVSSRQKGVLAALDSGEIALEEAVRRLKQIA
ncbi:MAG: DUF2089 domain-containing protein [Armatimonadetes bacterium]|nr:DUF2089 domain-containing protein [Armatimonadota bacterium]